MLGFSIRQKKEISEMLLRSPFCWHFFDLVKPHQTFDLIMWNFLVISLKVNLTTLCKVILYNQAKIKKKKLLESHDQNSLT